MDNESVTKVEEKAAKLLNIFRKEMENSSSEIDYINLIASCLVFKNLVVHHFKSSLRQDLVSEEEIELIINALLTESDDISKSAVTRIEKNKSEDTLAIN